MKRISRQDILDLPEYEKVRHAFRSRMIALKKRRRVFLGDRVMIVFENRETVISQIQEMMRAERIYEEEKILQEIEVYNPLIPDPGEISATLFIEITDPGRVREEMERFRGIDGGRAICLQVGDQKIFGAFEGGRSSETRVSAVHYLRFALASVLSEPEERRNFVERESRLILTLPHYQADTILDPETKQSLIADLTGTALQV